MKLIRPNYQPWCSRQHDMAQRQQADPHRYASAIERPAKRNILIRALLRIGTILSRGGSG